MRKIKNIIIILLTLSLTILSSCSFKFFWENQVKLPSKYDISYSLTQYDIDHIEKSYLKAKEIAQTDGNQNELILNWNSFILSVNWLSSQAQIALTLYYCDYLNEEAKERYLFAMSAYEDCYNYYTDLLKEIYNSKFKDAFFEGWEEKEINRILKSDEEVAELKKQNDELTVAYTSFSNEEKYSKTHEIYREIVANNQKIAKKYGYEDYYDYATELEYNRECTAEELASLRSSVANEVVPVLKKAIPLLEESEQKLTAEQKQKIQTIKTQKYDEGEINYYEEYIKSYQGNSTGKGLRHGIDNNNLLFGDEKSKAGAFNIYLWDVGTPYCYFGQGYQDLFTVAHETGHYYSAYAKADSSYTDIAEIHSQSNELLLLKFMETQLSKEEFEYFERYQIVDMLKTVVVSTIVDEFEYAVYNLPSVENYTMENFDSIMSNILTKYGGEEFILNDVTLIYNYWKLVVVENPVYYISYSISAISALGLYVQADESVETARENYKLLVEEGANLSFSNALTKSNFNNPFYSYAYQQIEKLIGVMEKSYSQVG